MDNPLQPDMVKDTVEKEPLANIIGKIASILNSENFPSGDRASLKRLHPEGPYPASFFKFGFAHLPDGWESRMQPWATILAGMALMNPKSHNPAIPFGKALAGAGYPEVRLERLLASEDSTLETLVLRCARFLGAKGASCNWTDIGYLLGLRGSTEKARFRIAKDFYHNTQSQKE